MNKPLHRISFTEEKETLLITLYAKALDNRSKHPILHDAKADEIAAQISRFSHLHIGESFPGNCASFIAF